MSRGDGLVICQAELRSRNTTSALQQVPGAAAIDRYVSFTVAVVIGGYRDIY